ncbi:MAG: hypothetical protein IIV90_00065 [Oscillospiraceae bacterium]|nr:hypothetical protein [Oscillospiraceae bacterium]
MATAQFTLCGAQSKWLIAAALAQSGLLEPYLNSGRILFKGSSTVSCLTRLLGGGPLRLCGRISPAGLKGPLAPSSGAHFLLYEKGTFTNMDGRLEDLMKTFGPGDLFVTGANALDSFGNAALLAGSPGGGAYGICLPYLYSSGAQTFVLASSSKLIPGNLTNLYPLVSQNNCQYSTGMACSLLPVPGRVFTETQALEAFAPVKAAVFAKGGHTGAEDAAAIQVWGEQAPVEQVLALVEDAKACPAAPLVEDASEPECRYPCAGCAQHSSCAYAGKQTIHHSLSFHR